MMVMNMEEYYEIIKQGYKDCSLDEKYLDEAVEKMKETVLNQTEAAMYPYGYRDVRQ